MRAVRSRTRIIFGGPLLDILLLVATQRGFVEVVLGMKLFFETFSNLFWQNISSLVDAIRSPWSARATIHAPHQTLRAPSRATTVPPSTVAVANGDDVDCVGDTAAYVAQAEGFCDGDGGVSGRAAASSLCPGFQKSHHRQGWRARLPFLCRAPHAPR